MSKRQHSLLMFKCSYFRTYLAFWIVLGFSRHDLLGFPDFPKACETIKMRLPIPFFWGIVQRDHGRDATFSMKKPELGGSFSPNELMNFSPPEIPWKPFLTCEDDDEMVTHVASARSDAKSKKKKKAIDMCFLCQTVGDLFFFGFRVPPSSKLGFGGGGFKLGALFLVGFLSWMLQRSPFLSKNPTRSTRAMNDGDVG